jgi:predicted metal-binding membrane protein
MRSAVGGMAMGGIKGIVPFLSAWVVMMVTMMVPATLPLILLYHHMIRKRLGPTRAWIGMALLLVGYVAVWAFAGLPVYAYNLLSGGLGSLAAALPALLLIVGGPTSSRRSSASAMHAVAALCPSLCRTGGRARPGLCGWG